MKRFFLLVLAALLASLAACGPDDLAWGSPGTDPRSEVHAAEGGEEPQPSESGASSDSVYDPVVSTPMCSDHTLILQDLQENGRNLPDEIFWIDNDVLQDALGVKLWAAGCRDAVVHFDGTMNDERGSAELAEEYGVTPEQMESAEMKSWPWSSWMELSSSFELYATVRPMDEQPEIWPLPPESTRLGGGEVDLWHKVLEDMEYDGKPSPTPDNGREPVENYQPPEWGPAEGHEGYEMAVVAETDEGVPLSVRLRWQKEGFWFFAEIPGHTLEAFWEHVDVLFVKAGQKD